MDPIDLPVRSRPGDDLLDHDLAEIDAAIELVRRGLARRVLVVGLRAADRVIGTAVAHGQQAGIAVRPMRDELGALRTIEIRG